MGLLSEGISVSSEGNQKNGIYNWPFLSPDLRRLAVFNASTLPDDGLGEFDLLAVWILHEIPEGRRMTPSVACQHGALPSRGQDAAQPAA